LAALCTHYGIGLNMYFLFNESLITRARNYCCDEFVRSDCTHMMFIDSDIGFNPQDVLALLALQSDDSPYDVLCGPYPKKCIAWEKIKMAVDKGFGEDNPNELEKFVGDYVFNPKAGTSQIPIGEPCEVGEGGTGFMMIRKATLHKYAEAYPHLLYRPDHVRTEHFDGTREIMAYFDCVIDRGYTPQALYDFLKDVANGDYSTDVVQAKAAKFIDFEKNASKRYLSEDYKFCYDVAKAGMKIWLCPWIKLQHVGAYVFGGSLADLASLGAVATADAGQMDKIKKAANAKK
jgi:hypothetical protein